MNSRGTERERRENIFFFSLIRCPNIWKFLKFSFTVLRSVSHIEWIICFFNQMITFIGTKDHHHRRRRRYSHHHHPCYLVFLYLPYFSSSFLLMSHYWKDRLYPIAMRKKTIILIEKENFVTFLQSKKKLKLWTYFYDTIETRSDHQLMSFIDIHMSNAMLTVIELGQRNSARNSNLKKKKKNSNIEE